MTESLSYLAALAACLGITLPLELTGLARVYRRPVRLAATLLPVLVVFGAWDLIAAALGQWWWSPRHIIGLHMGGLPVEEWLFFVTIPVCAVLTYEALGTGTAMVRRPAGQAREVPDGR